MQTRSNGMVDASLKYLLVMMPASTMARLSDLNGAASV